MWAVDRELELAGLKTYAAGHEGATFVVLLFETATTKLVAVIEADKLGPAAHRRRERRGCEVPRQGGRRFARDHRLRLAGAQPGGLHPRGVALDRAVVAYCRNEERLAAFCKETGAEAGESHRDPAQQDVVVTVTTSRDPVLRGEWLQPGAVVCAVGANDPRRARARQRVLERAAFVCCDSIENAKRESGDLIEPVEAGVLDWLEVHELQEVVAGELPGRQADDDIVVFKSNGIAAWDVAIGRVALERARERGVGTRRSSVRRAARSDRAFAERVDHLGPVEQAATLLRRRPVAHVGVLEDLAQRPAALVLADHVGREPLLLRGAREQERERVAQEARKPGHGLDPSRGRVANVKKPSPRFAEREVHGVDDRGEPERIVIWIERLPGALWAVGRAVNPQHRPSDEPRGPMTTSSRGTSSDALDSANGTLSDDARVSAEDGRAAEVKPFERTSC